MLSNESFLLTIEPPIETVTEIFFSSIKKKEFSTKNRNLSDIKSNLKISSTGKIPKNSSPPHLPMISTDLREDVRD